MKRRTKIIIYVAVFIITFLCSALVRIQHLGNAPMKLIAVDWNESVGSIYKDMEYENSNGHKYDLYIPQGLDKGEPQYLIVFIHGGSFNSGSKEDGDAWCKFYASKGYITATIDYTLQNQGKDASINLMNAEIKNAIKAIKQDTANMGYNIVSMASCGVSAGGTLAMNLAYSGDSAIPIKFVFQLAAPTYFEPDDWELLMKVNKWDTKEEFLRQMTGGNSYRDDYISEIEKISPASQVSENSPPTLIGYGLIDHCVPLNQKCYLIDALEKHNIIYEYIEFPKSNHGMYNDLDKLQLFIDKSLEYCELYLKR